MWTALAGAFDPQAKWRAVDDGPWNCEDRDQILAVMRDNFDRGPAGELEDAFEVADRVVVAFRPDRAEPPWPLEDGIRYLVLTFTGERIVEMKGCIDRASAVSYASAA